MGFEAPIKSAMTMITTNIDQFIGWMQNGTIQDMPLWVVLGILSVPVAILVLGIVIWAKG